MTYRDLYYGLTDEQRDMDITLEFQGELYPTAVRIAEGDDRGEDGQPILCIKAETETEKMEGEIRECHPEGRLACYCDNGHAQNGTVCMYCLYKLLGI